MKAGYAPGAAGLRRGCHRQRDRQRRTCAQHVPHRAALRLAAKRDAGRFTVDGPTRGAVLTVGFDGSTLVFAVEGRTNGAQDEQLLELLDGQVPNGTPVTVDCLSGGLDHVGDVGDH